MDGNEAEHPARAKPCLYCHSTGAGAIDGGDRRRRWAARSGGMHRPPSNRPSPCQNRSKLIGSSGRPATASCAPPTLGPLRRQPPARRQLNYFAHTQPHSAVATRARHNAALPAANPRPARWRCAAGGLAGEEWARGCAASSCKSLERPCPPARQSSPLPTPPPLPTDAPPACPPAEAGRRGAARLLSSVAGPQDTPAKR